MELLSLSIGIAIYLAAGYLFWQGVRMGEEVMESENPNGFWLTVTLFWPLLILAYILYAEENDDENL